MENLYEHFKAKDFVVLDNFFEEDTYSEIKEYLYGHDLSWNFADNVTSDSLNANEFKYGFSHRIYDHRYSTANNTTPQNRNIVIKMTDLLEKYFDVKEIIRVRAGLHLPTPKGSVTHDAHVDSSMAHYTALFYFCEEEGGAGSTKIYNEKYDLFMDEETDRRVEDLTLAAEIEPRDNRVLIFKGNVFHSSSSPEKINRRIAVNVNFLGFPLK